MNRFWGHTLSTAVLAVTAGSAFPACAHNDGSLYVDAVLAPPTPSGGICAYTGTPSSPVINFGKVDGGLTSSYSPTFLLANALVAQANPTIPQAESARLLIGGADVRVVDPVDNSEWMNADVLATTTIEPAAGGTPSYAPIETAVMDAKAIAHFTPSSRKDPAKLAEVYVKFYGNTLGGQYVESDEFLFPVYVCNGCLVSFPAGATVQYCSGAIAATSSTAACQLGQDQQTDCQKCYSGYPAVCTSPP